MWEILNSYTQFVPHISMKSTLTNQRSEIETDTQQVRCCLTRIFVPLARQKGSHHEDRNICLQLSAYNAHHSASIFGYQRCSWSQAHHVLDINAAVDHRRTTFWISTLQLITGAPRFGYQRCSWSQAHHVLDINAAVDHRCTTFWISTLQLITGAPRFGTSAAGFTG